MHGKRYTGVSGDGARARRRQRRTRVGAPDRPRHPAANRPTTAELRAVNEQLLLAGLREQAIRARAEQMAAERAAILRQIADGVVTADASGRLTFVNAAARRINDMLAPGLSIGACIDAGRILTLDRQPLRYEEVPLVRALRGETVVGVDLCVRQPDGTELLVRDSALPVRADDGTLLGAVLTMRDVTAEHALERQKDEFFASLSHDLQGPLTTIQTSIGVVLANEPDGMPESLHRLLVNAERASERMASLVAELLELARLQAGRVRPRLARFDLGELARQAARDGEPSAQAHGQRVMLALPDVPVPFLGDDGRLARALLNLLDNASRYGKDGGAIRLALTLSPDEAVFSVADDGPGIPPSELGQVFERFYRRPSDVAAGRAGSGLGLATVRALAELHGGRAWAESGPAGGTTFFLALPLLAGSDGGRQR